MPLSPGQRIGAYQIVALVGKGGMGEVYRARDATLGRDVAIKVLGDSFAGDPARVARFEREAKMLASLNHNNVAHLYGLENADGHRALVMELVPGQTVGDRIALGPVPTDESVRIALQVAHALEAAHESSIVHRDLKPANIKIRPDGTVKVLDFGLAKAMEPAAGHESASTVTTDSLTRQGTIMGTPAYMSPEQARGDTVDARTDIWAFGAVLYEMLSGRTAFGGKSSTDTLLAVLTREPDWKALPDSTPSGLRRVLRRCLAKDPTRRFRAVADVRLELEDLSTDDPTHESEPRRPGWLWAALAATSVALVVMAGLLAWAWPRAPAAAVESPKAVRFSFEAPDGMTIVDEHFAVSPDGASIAFVAASEDGRRSTLWVRPLESVSARELPGTDGAYLPFWSPDGRSLAFFASGQLKRLDLAGGSPRALASTPAVSLGGAWNADGIIVFSARSVINRVPAAGGSVTQVVAINPDREDSLRFPRFLPDGRRFLYVARGRDRADNWAYVGDLNGKSTRLFQTTSEVEYAPPGYLLYAANDTLVARRFNPETLVLDSSAVSVVDGVGTIPTGLVALFRSSPAGTLAYQLRARESGELRWLDGRGRPIQTAATTTGSFWQMRLRPDGRQAVVSFDDDGDGRNSIWTLRSDRTAPTRLTFAGTHDRDAIWSPDGSRIAFSSSRLGSYALFTKPAAGTQAEKLLAKTADDLWAEDWSPDGRFIAVRRGRATTSTDIVIWPLEGDPIPIVVADSMFSEHGARFSPDGRWVAYVSEETGRPEVYVQAFPPSGARWQISTDGGDDPAWGNAGRELLSIRPDGVLAATDVGISGTTLTAGVTRALFMVGLPRGVAGNRFDVSPDGGTVVVDAASDAARRNPLMVVLNWQADLARTAPAR